MVVTKHLIFVRDSLAAVVTVGFDDITEKEEIMGFYLNPIVSEKEEYIDADYVKHSVIDVAEGKFPPEKLLGLKLTLPMNIPQTQKYPCVILVHGSGPHDADETIMKNKPFRDIALGLSSNGIAVLRYEKRTYADKNIDVSTLTINEETVNDAVDMINFIKERHSDKIDKIYVLGHSLGGYIMPRIAKLAKNADGFILLAGSAR